MLIDIQTGDFPKGIINIDEDDKNISSQGEASQIIKKISIGK